MKKLVLVLLLFPLVSFGQDAKQHFDSGAFKANSKDYYGAISNYNKAIEQNPNYADAYYNLSYLKKYTANDPQITKMKSLLSDSKLSRSDRINLCFALAKVNENLDNQDELFKYLT